MNNSTFILSAFICLFLISCSSDSDYEVTVNSNNQIGKVSGGGTFGHAKDCTVSAYSENNDEAVFSGWYINEQLVSYIPDYTFSVVSHTDLEARFTPPEQSQDFTGKIAWQGVRDAQVVSYTFFYPLSIKAGESVTIDYTQSLSVTNSITCKSTLGTISIDTGKKQLYFSSESKGPAIISLSGNTSLICNFCITVR